jgi:hypothetical protein
MASYGTIMIAKLAGTASLADWQKSLEDWKRERNVAAFQGEYTLLGDDGKTLVSCVVFESKDKYFALANDPEQDKWWRERVAPLLDGEPQWIDGTWA